MQYLWRLVSRSDNWHNVAMSNREALRLVARALASPGLKGGEMDDISPTAEFQARTKKKMHMRDWAKKLDDFLRLNDREVLQGFGNISSQLAKETADRQFTTFDHKRREVEDAQAAEDFAKEVKELEDKAKEFTEDKPSTNRKA
jgi:hypothetical protein